MTDEQRQKLIIRQSSLKSASAFHNGNINSTVLDVINDANSMYEWAFYNTYPKLEKKTIIKKVVKSLAKDTINK